jgi:hypothetical protein
MAKLIKITESKAIRMEGVVIRGAKSVSIRQLYQTKSSDGKWMPGKQGINIPIENAEKIAKYLAAIAAGDEFKEIDINKD